MNKSIVWVLLNPTRNFYIMDLCYLVILCLGKFKLSFFEKSVALKINYNILSFFNKMLPIITYSQKLNQMQYKR